MRIDSNTPATSELVRNSGSSAAAITGRGRDGEAAGTQDTAQLTTGSGNLQGLLTSLQGVPDVRQQRIETLRDQLSSGTYQISPGRIATAMMSDARRRVG